jgi:hypothetical protein
LFLFFSFFRIFCANSLGIAFFFGGGDGEEADSAKLELDEEEDVDSGSNFGRFTPLRA